jgi:hypothetical protein
MQIVSRGTKCSHTSIQLTLGVIRDLKSRRTLLYVKLFDQNLGWNVPRGTKVPHASIQ